MTGDGFAGRSTRATLHASFVEGRTYGSCLFLVVPGVPDAPSYQTRLMDGRESRTRRTRRTCRTIIVSNATRNRQLPAVAAGEQGGESVHRGLGNAD